MVLGDVTPLMSHDGRFATFIVATVHDDIGAETERRHVFATGHAEGDTVGFSVLLTVSDEKPYFQDGDKGVAECYQHTCYKEYGQQHLPPCCLWRILDHGGETIDRHFAHEALHHNCLVHGDDTERQYKRGHSSR